MKNKQYRDHETFKLIKRIRTDISVKENRTLVKKKRSELYYNSKRIETKIIISNIYETRETTIYKRLSRRVTL